jgi:hypothetical protein
VGPATSRVRKNSDSATMICQHESKKWQKSHQHFIASLARFIGKRKLPDD